MTDQSKFYSKILLFGEYSIIRGHSSLAIPYELFSGHLSLSHSFQNKESNNELKAFHHYLKNLDIIKTRELKFDLRAFEFDLNQGLYFDSTIPKGHGVGSSGAICANIYARYAQEVIQRTAHIQLEDMYVLKNIFAKMESHFHGSSSGIDPLLSYLSVPLLTRNQFIEKVSIPKSGNGEVTLFLLDTGRSRRTEPLVHLFLEKLKNKEFLDIFDNEIKEANENCISSFLANDERSLNKHFKTLSQFQLSHFLPMIPKLYQELWATGLETDEFYLKLCGAGGGGFILGLTRNFENFCQKFKDEQVRALFRFNSMV